MSHLENRSRLYALSLGIVLALAFMGLHPGLSRAASPAWRPIAVSGPTNLPPVTSEVQELTVDAEGGSERLGFEGQSTAPIPFAATAAQVAAALEALTTIGGVGGTVEVSGGPGGPQGADPYSIRFAGALAGTNVAALTVDASDLTGTTPTATVTTETQGGEPGEGEILITATNVGGGEAGGPLAPIKVEYALPAGLTTKAAPSGKGWTCPTGAGQTSLECVSSAAVGPNLTLEGILVPVVVGPGAGDGGTARLNVSGGGAPSASYAEPITVSAHPATAGIASFQAGAYDEDGNLYTQAGGHPFSASTAIFVNTVVAPNGTIAPAGDSREITVGLPAGFIGNPQATPLCATEGGGGESECPEGNESIVGRAVTVLKSFGNRELGERGKAIYNSTPPEGSPAEFNFNIISGNIHIVAAVRNEEDYGVNVASPNTLLVYPLYGAVVTLWGVPGAEAHDPQRCGLLSSCPLPNHSSAGDAFLTNPTSCALEAEEAMRGSGPLTSLALDTWQQAGLFDHRIERLPAVTGCAALGAHFHPGFSFAPATQEAASPSAYIADLTIPQEGLTEAEGLAAPQLKRTVIALPKGVDLNPSAADGLQACSEAEMGLLTTEGAAPSAIRFDGAPPSCPEASKLGTVEARTPLLRDPVKGTIYLAAQEENPFGSLLALYLVLNDPKDGILVKLAGEVRPDAGTGQLTTIFDDNPQLPVEDLVLNFRGGGPHAPLATPSVCGTYTTHGELTPWSAPESGPPAQTESSFQVTSGPGGGACATSEVGLPFAPSLEAGTTSTQAGAYAPLTIKLARKDGEQELTHLDFTLPPGLTGKLAGIPYCPDAAIASAAAKSGKAEQADPSCPAASELGTVDTAAGVGSEPIHVGGHVYLAGPYKGAPLSAVVVTPAVAGPFDLGDVVVRAGLYVNQETAQITARSDEIPHILKGIPLQLRSVDIKVTRDGFTLNPTSCDPMTVTSSVGGLNGGTASPSSRFQVGGCSALPFKPQLKLSVIGKTNRNAKPKLKAVLTAAPGEANIRRAQVNLPHSEFLEQDHIKTVCTRVQWAEGDGNGSACPKGSIYGKARAWTPLLDKPLEGFVYLRSNGGERKLPDLVAALDGQIDIALWGKVDSGPNHGIRNTFEVVPDAPVSRFVLEMFGKKKGLLVNSEPLCSPKAKRRAIVRLVGQNGKVRHFKPLVANSCKKKSKAPKGQGHATSGTRPAPVRQAR